MSNVIINREKIDILANAISDKSGVPVTMTLDEMVEAVDGIEVGGGTPTLETVTKTYTPSTAAVTDTITPSRGYDGIEEVDVTVSAVPTGVIGSGSWIDNSTTTKKVYRYIRNITQAGYLTAQSIGTTLNLDKESSTITPTESIQSVTPSGLYKYLDSVTIDAIPSNYVGSGITQRSSSDLTVSGATVTIPSGYYSAAASKAVANGTAGTPTATKGTVSNHQVSITPSVTNTTGYITGSTKTGTAVTVTASELASGNKAITQNGTGIDVVGYSTVSVNVAGAEYTRTVVVPQQTVTPNSSRVASLNAIGAINDAENYIVTLDGVEWFTTSETLWSANYVIGEANWFLDTPSNYIYPFGVAREGSTTEAAFSNTNQHTIKIERLDFVTGGTTLTTKNITANGTYNASSDSADGYSSVTVNVPSSSPTIQSLSITPTTSQQTFNASGVDGYKPVTVAAMPTMTLPTTAASSATSGYTSKATIGRSTAAQYINIPPGYNSAGAYYVISATPNGSVTAPSSISGTAATVSTGTNTLTLTKTVSVTPNVTTAGYVSNGTAGNSSVSLTASVTTMGAQTITPGTSTVSLQAGTYLTGLVSITGDADLVGSNILSTANIFGVQGTVDFIDVYIRSAAPTSSVGNDGDIYIQE